jgi:hypothetical protein
MSGGTDSSSEHEEDTSPTSVHNGRPSQLESSLDTVPILPVFDVPHYTIVGGDNEKDGDQAPSRDARLAGYAQNSLARKVSTFLHFYPGFCRLYSRR